MRIKTCVKGSFGGKARPALTVPSDDLGNVHFITVTYQLLPTRGIQPVIAPVDPILVVRVGAVVLQVTTSAAART